MTTEPTKIGQGPCKALFSIKNGYQMKKNPNISKKANFSTDNIREIPKSYTERTLKKKGISSAF